MCVLMSDCPFVCIKIFSEVPIIRFIHLLILHLLILLTHFTFIILNLHLHSLTYSFYILHFTYPYSLTFSRTTPKHSPPLVPHQPASPAGENESPGAQRQSQVSSSSRNSTLLRKNPRSRGASETSAGRIDPGTAFPPYDPRFSLSLSVSAANGAAASQLPLGG